MAYTSNDVSLGTSERESLALDRSACERIAKAADISLPSVREHIRDRSEPHNRHVAAHFRRALAAEAGRLRRGI